MCREAHRAWHTIKNRHRRQFYTVRGAGERRKVEGRKILSGFAIFHFLATKPEDASKVRERKRVSEGEGEREQ